MGYRQAEVCAGLLSPQGGDSSILVSNLLPQAAWPALEEQGQRYGQVTILGSRDLKEKTIKLGARTEAQIQKGSSWTELKFTLLKL